MLYNREIKRSMVMSMRIKRIIAAILVLGMSIGICSCLMHNETAPDLLFGLIGGGINA